MKRNLSKVFVIFVMLIVFTGCYSNTIPVNQDKASWSLGGEASAIKTGEIPGWLYESIKSKFQRPELVKPEDIVWGQVNFKSSDEPHIFASLTMDRLNGVFVIYELKNNKYEEIFARQEPVYGIQIFGAGPKRLSFVSGHGGTGIQENHFHVIGFTDKGIQEIWEGIAEKFTASGPPPYVFVTGAINMTMDNTLYYTQIVKTYHQFDFDPAHPDQTEQKTEIYHLDPETGMLKKIE